MLRKQINQHNRRSPPTTGRNLDFFFTPTSGKSAKLFTRKLCQVYTVRKPHMLTAQNFVKFRGHTADFFCKHNFAHFLDEVPGKKKPSRFGSVVGGVSLQQHVLFVFPTPISMKTSPNICFVWIY